MLLKDSLGVIEAVLWLQWPILNYVKAKIKLLNDESHSTVRKSPLQTVSEQALTVPLMHRSPLYIEKGPKAPPSALGWKYKPLLYSCLVLTKQVWNCVVTQSLMLLPRWLKSCSFLFYLMPFLSLANADPGAPSKGTGGAVTG